MKYGLLALLLAAALPMRAQQHAATSDLEKKMQWFADAKLTYGVRGLDFDTDENSFNYGSNIYKNYDENRPFDEGVSIGQGNKTTIIIADFQVGYVVNPTSNLKLFGNFLEIY